MTQQEIIDMARQAGLTSINKKSPYLRDCLERFAKLVAAKERVACWNILFDYAGRDDLKLEDESLLKHLADLIKARGEA